MAVRTDPDAPAAAERHSSQRPARTAEQRNRPEQVHQPGSPRRTPPNVAVAVVLVTLVLGALMNGPGLESAATGLSVGRTRDAAMSVAAGVARSGAALGLDRPHQWLAAVRDGDLGARVGTAAELAAAQGSDLEQRGRPQPDGQTSAAIDARSDAPDDGARDVASGEQDDATQEPGRATQEPDNAAREPDNAVQEPGNAAQEPDRTTRSITADAPLEVLLAGDSLMGTVADGYGRRSTDDELVDWDKDVRISTGLARPDVLNWPLHLQQLLDARDPDVVVLLLGGNDDQSLVGGADGVVHYGQPGWEEEYQERATQLQTIAASQGRTVVWLELPAVRPGKLERARQRMNAAARRAAAGTGALLIDTDAIIAPEGYTVRLRGSQVRADDGVHLTHAGGDLVAEVIDRVVSDRFGLPG